MKEKNLIIFIPFAYGGNPAAESGPKCIFNMLQSEKDFNDVEMICITQDVDESPLQFLANLEKIVSSKANNANNIIFVGGNHLSIFPVYSYFYNLAEEKAIITLDAHRDYYPEKSLNHATFMKYLPVSNTTNHYLIGSRDFEMHNEKHKSIIFKPLTLGSRSTSIELKSPAFLDIDLDVIEPTQFPWCGSALSGGLRKNEVEEIIIAAKRENCHVLALSEYIPNWDMEFEGAKMIISFIRKFLFFYD